MTGFSLVELILFIIIVSVLATGLLAGVNQSLSGSGAAKPLSLGMQLAQERMELILPQRRQLGFAGITTASFDPCTSAPASTQPLCTTWPAGYTVTASLQGYWPNPPDTDFKVITVNVSGPTTTQLQALVANY
jgi:type II secretory pathway pseudopilin PulG